MSAGGAGGSMDAETAIALAEVAAAAGSGAPLGGLERTAPEETKPYLGGFRHKVSGVVYHHACTQTVIERRSKWADKPPAFTRETQTVTLKTRSAQTKRECATQMARRDLYIGTSKDKELAPRTYFSAAELHSLKAEKTQVIQNYWRGYCSRKRAWEMRDARDAEREREAVVKAEAEAAATAAHQEEVRRRMHPRSSADFEVLYNELEAWRAAETRRINSEGLPETERLEALAQLLHKETKLLQTIDRLKLTATKENREKRIAKMLSLMAKPKEWEMGDGEVATVHTPFTTRAKELMDLYKGLGMSLNTEERLEVLLHVKWTVKQFDCQLTREICDLVDREADLLNRGRPEKALAGLRKRVSNMFLQFIETPEFNPEATRFLKVPRK